tara:strand:- start:502 stop:771 length:270 start_codon:yes stop_codon:yes gene_type:complete
MHLGLSGEDRGEGGRLAWPRGITRPATTGTQWRDVKAGDTVKPRARRELDLLGRGAEPHFLLLSTEYLDSIVNVTFYYDVSPNDSRRKH